MAWQFEDRGKTKICRNLMASYSTWAFVLAAVVTAIVGLPFILTEVIGIEISQSGNQVDPLYAFLFTAVGSFVVAFMVNDSLVELELDTVNNTLHFRSSSLFSNNHLRIPLDKIESLFLEKVTIETYRREAGAFESMSSASIKGKPSISRHDELSIRIAGGNVVHVTTASPSENLDNTAQEIAQFVGLTLTKGETTKQESYTVKRNLGGKEKVDFFS